MRRISLARKNLFQDRRRASLAVTGVAASLLLVLVLEGIFAGAMQQVIYGRDGGDYSFDFYMETKNVALKTILSGRISGMVDPPA